MSFLPERPVEGLGKRPDHVIERRALDGRKHDRGWHAGVKPHVRQSFKVALINGHERGVIGRGVVATFVGQAIGRFVGQAIGRDQRRGAAVIRAL
jgi:hypothetical protein